MLQVLERSVMEYDRAPYEFEFLVVWFMEFEFPIVSIVFSSAAVFLLDVFEVEQDSPNQRLNMAIFGKNLMRLKKWI